MSGGDGAGDPTTVLTDEITHQLAAAALHEQHTRQLRGQPGAVIASDKLEEAASEQLRRISEAEQLREGRVRLRDRPVEIEDRNRVRGEVDEPPVLADLGPQLQHAGDDLAGVTQ